MSGAITTIESKAQFDKLVKETRTVVTDFYADWCAPCKQIAPLFQKMAQLVAGNPDVKFVKVNTETHKDIASEHGVTALPTFIVFRNGKVQEKFQGANPESLKELVMKIAEGESADSSGGSGGSGSGSGGGSWRGAGLPRGYGDVTDQIEIKGCELLNADDDAGSVRVLFDGSKPSALDKKEGAKDWVESGEDEQMLLFMPLQAMIKLHTLQLTSVPPKDDEDAPMRPSTIHLYTNRPHNLDFAEADDTPPTQAIELEDKDWNADGTANISLRFVKFQNINSLVIYVKDGDGDSDKTRLDRVRLIGESGEKREMGKLEKIGDEPGE